jgi:KipI family sensor histidine kinase inhibitor
MSVGLYPVTRYRLAGDRGLLAEYGEGIDPGVNRRVRAMSRLLEGRPLEGVLEIVPTYRSLLLVYDPLRVEPAQLQARLTALEGQAERVAIPPPRTLTIPVCYGGEFGPDIGYVAETHGLTEAEVIRLHAGARYTIYMVGFTPGFPFLGGLPEQLHTPRLETPRTAVPAGSVGIANNQTGIYPVASPGGWRLIGRTPLRLFRPESSDPFLYRAGDEIGFEAISATEFAARAAQQAAP